jgi:carboxyl-terminal processing protease
MEEINQDNFSEPVEPPKQTVHPDALRPEKVTAYYPLLLAIMLAVGVYLGTMIGGAPAGSKRETLAKLNNVLNIIEEKYVDEVDRNKLVDDAIISLMKNLDPHSYYMTAEEARRSREELSGSFGGVGIQFMVYRDTLIVTHLIPGSPAEEEGVKVFDRIIKVDKKSFAGRKITTDDVINTLRGPFGTSVMVTIKRRGESKLLKKKIIRGNIPVSSVETSIMLNEDIGYIKVTSFGETTYRDFLIASNKLLNRGMKKLILDLRNNGGGYLTAANSMADEFLEDGKLIVYTEGKAYPREDTYATSRGNLEDVEVAVLINEGTASASEIVSGALQDHDKGIIIGRRSFGKGLVQQEFTPNNDGSSLRLTIARYYTPSGRSIQKPYGEGIDYENELMDRYNNKELFEPDSSIFVDSLKYKTGKGRIVYGGGGIYPDLFVPLDTTGGSSLLTQLSYSRIIGEFAVLFAESNTGFENKFKGYGDYNLKFNPSDELIDEMLAFATEKESLVYDPKDVEYSKERIRQLIKAEIARMFWNSEGLYKVECTTDYDVQIAIKELNKKSGKLRK